MSLSAEIPTPVPFPHSCALGSSAISQDGCLACIRNGHQATERAVPKSTTGTIYTQEQIGELIRATRNKQAAAAGAEKDAQEKELRPKK